MLHRKRSATHNTIQTRTFDVACNPNDAMSRSCHKSIFFLQQTMYLLISETLERGKPTTTGLKDKIVFNK